MDNLDLTTSHNIVVTVELASTLQRMLATFLDGIIMFVYYIIIAMAFFSNGAESIGLLFIVPVALCYHLIFEYFNDGQSPGKKIMKLRVIGPVSYTHLTLPTILLV